MRWPFEKTPCNWRVCHNNGTPRLTHHAPSLTNVLSAGCSQHCSGVARLRRTRFQNVWLSRLGAVCFSKQELNAALFAKRGRKSEHAASCNPLTDLFCNVSASRDSCSLQYGCSSKRRKFWIKTFLTFQKLPMLKFTTCVAFQDPRTQYLQFPGFYKVVAFQTPQIS